MKNALTPHITEKAYTGIQESPKIANSYTFRIQPNLDKQLVRKLVEKEFSVNVVDVRIVNLPGKNRRFKGVAGRTSDRKKAIVRLAIGQRIAAFDTETNKESNK